MQIRCAIVGLLLCMTVRFGEAQVVQLPTQRVFTVDTTVSVPDRGQALLGGVHRARSATVSRGVPVLGHLPGLAPGLRDGGHAFGLGSSQAYARATIIDLQAMDEALLTQATAQGSVRVGDSALQRKAQFLSRYVARDAKQPAPGHIDRR